MIDLPVTQLRSLLIRLAFVTLTVAVIASCGKSAPPPPTPEVEVITVDTRTVPVVFSRVAQTEGSRDVEVVARVSGFLEKIAYQEGAPIQEGEVMFEMDRKPFLADVEAARGELEASKARLWTATANFDRTLPLAEAEALSQSDLDQATGEQRAAEAAVYSAQANLTQAELNLSYATIRAPVTGMTGKALQREGAYLNALSDSGNLSYVAKTDPIWVNFSVSQNEQERFRKQVDDKGIIENKFEFEIVLADGEVFPNRGTLDFAAPIYDASTGTFSARAVVENPDHVLRPGMFVTANVLGVERPNAIVVPQEAVQQTSNGHVVWVVNNKEQTERRPVVMSDWVKTGWVVEHGLSAGERVIVTGVNRIRPGITVKAVAAKPGKKAPAATKSES